jgi:hypothetical protein
MPAGNFILSADGSMLAVSDEATYATRVYRLPGARPVGERADFVARDWSPDNERLSGAERWCTPEEALVAWKPRTGEVKRTADDGWNGLWSTDGLKIAYGGQQSIGVHDLATGEDSPVLQSVLMVVGKGWSSDSRYVAFGTQPAEADCMRDTR